MLPDLATRSFPCSEYSRQARAPLQEPTQARGPLLIASYTLLLNHVFEQPVQPKGQGFNFFYYTQQRGKVQKHLMNFLVQKPGFYCVKKVENWLAE